MIVLKATQDKVLRVLQSVAGIVERRHTLPIVANVLLRKTSTGLPEQINRATTGMVMTGRDVFVTALRQGCRVMLGAGSRLSGFFSASKANLRNAP